MRDDGVSIRPARRVDEELVALQRVELEAGRLFVDVGMPEIAGDEPPSLDELRAAPALLVAVDAGGRPVGYARIEIVDGHAHLEQLSVVPTFGRRGIGARLLDEVAAWARDRGDVEVTLTTFRDVPFNGPYYRRHGYVEVLPDRRGPELADLVATEASHGLDPEQRITMHRPLDGDPERATGPGGAGRPSR